jgi:glycosyltransferase involved in cell wall biosynthesis
MSGPFISCMMPTYGRKDYVCQSIGMFLAQDYAHKELIILNDSPSQTYVCDVPDVRVINVDERYPTLGEKRNAIIEQARGEFIAVWDDDDVHLPWRLSFSVEQARQKETPFYFPLEFWAYWGEKALLDNQAIPSWCHHGVAFFEKDLWRAAGGYPAQTVGEDTALARKMLAILGKEWPRFDVARYDRFFIMRGKSKYHHTAIAGGSEEPDTIPGCFLLEPRKIDDPILYEVAAELVQLRAAR